MITIDLAALLERLHPVCRHALEEAGSLCISQRGAEVTVGHLLYKLLEQPLCDVRLVLADAGLDLDEIRHSFATAFTERDGRYGHAYPSFSPLLVESLQDAWLLSREALAQGFAIDAFETLNHRQRQVARPIIRGARLDVG